MSSFVLDDFIEKYVAPPRRTKNNPTGGKLLRTPPPSVNNNHPAPSQSPQAVPTPKHNNYPSMPMQMQSHAGPPGHPQYVQQQTPLSHIHK